MPIIDDKYQAPTWNNDAAPAIDADELQAMCDTIEQSDDFSRNTPALNGFVWNQAIGTLNLMENMCGGVYAENMLPDVFNLTFGSKIAQSDQVFFRDGYMHILGVLGMPRCGFNSTSTSALTPKLETTGCRVFERISDKSGPDYPEIMRFTPFAYYQTTTFSMRTGGSTNLVAQNVQLKDDDGNLLWSGQVADASSAVQSTDASVLLKPDKVYHLYAAAVNGGETSVTQSFFSGSEVEYSSGTFQTIPLENVYQKTKAILLLRGANMSSVHCEADIDGQSVAFSGVKTFQDAYYDGRNAATRSCQCARFECEIPRNSINISAKVYMEASSVEIYDYVLFFT